MNWYSNAISFFNSKVKHSLRGAGFNSRNSLLQIERNPIRKRKNYIQYSTMFSEMTSPSPISLVSLVIHSLITNST
jgi:hypothetical protein